MRTTIANFLFSRLRQMGIAHVFGVPGDFNLQLLEQMNEVDGLEFVGACNELNAAYAADGYGRLNGVSALLTTYGVGDLSAVCGIAGACAEHVPIVFLSGAPPLYAMESRLRVHHSLAEGNFDNVRNCMEEFTAAYARITPANAVTEIDRVLLACWREKLPVFLQIPSNISYLEIEAPDQPLNLALPSSDPERLQSAVDRIAALLHKARRPALLVDMDADRSALAGILADLVSKCQIPYAAFRTGKGILSESNPLYRGVFNGKASAKHVADAVLNSDCLIATAPCYTEGSPMMAPEAIHVAAHVYIRGYSVTIEDEVYEGVTASQLLARLLEVVDAVPTRSPQPTPALAPEPFLAQHGAALTHHRLWPRMERFLRPADVVIAENGTSALAMASVRLPEGCSYIAQPIWGSIGFTLPALLGSQIAAPNRRQILFIGDGSLQLTVQELSTILNRGLKPIIFVLNNRGYTIERYILGAKAAYNNIANWNYLALAQAFAPTVKVHTASIQTEDELEAALLEAETAKTASFIELCLDPMDAPQLLKVFGPAVAEMDYGPRGPQRKM